MGQHLPFSSPVPYPRRVRIAQSHVLCTRPAGEVREVDACEDATLRRERCAGDGGDVRFERDWSADGVDDRGGGLYECELRGCQVAHDDVADELRGAAIWCIWEILYVLE